MPLFILGEFPFVYWIVTNPPAAFPGARGKRELWQMLLARQIHHRNWTDITGGAGLGLEAEQLARSVRQCVRCS